MKVDLSQFPPRIVALARGIVQKEGGLVNDPDDLGGLTNRGVTYALLVELGFDLNGDGVVDKKDLIGITEEQAIMIFIMHFFYGMNLDQAPEPLQEPLFDMAVNSGDNAVEILQRLLAQRDCTIAVDGVMGPMTAKACKRRMDRANESFVDDYGAARREYYYRLGDKRVKSRKYCVTLNGGKGGWIRHRAEPFMSPDRHFTLDQHRERIAPWHGVWK